MVNSVFVCMYCIVYIPTLRLVGDDTGLFVYECSQSTHMWWALCFIVFGFKHYVNL